MSYKVTRDDASESRGREDLKMHLMFDKFCTSYSTCIIIHIYLRVCPFIIDIFLFSIHEGDFFITHNINSSMCLRSHPYSVYPFQNLIIFLKSLLHREENSCDRVIVTYLFELYMHILLNVRSFC